MSCGVGCRRGSDPVLLWLWRRPAATAPIKPLAWEPPYAAGVVLEKAKRQKKKRRRRRKDDYGNHVAALKNMYSVMVVEKVAHNIVPTFVVIEKHV